MTQPEGLKDREQRAREAEHAYYRFGCAVWLWLADNWSSEAGWEIAEMTVTAGLAERVRYDPDKHGECDAEPGDEIVWPLKGDPKNQNPRAEQAEAKLAEAERERDEAQRFMVRCMSETEQVKISEARMRDSIPFESEIELVAVIEDARRDRDAALADAARLREAIEPSYSLLGKLFGTDRDEAWEIILGHPYRVLAAALASTDASDWLESKLGPLREREERLCEIGLRMVSDLEAWLTEIPEEDRTTRGCIKTQKLIDEAGDAFSEPSSGGDWLQQRLKAERERCAVIAARKAIMWSAAEDSRSADYRHGVESAASRIAAAIRALDGTP